MRQGKNPFESPVTQQPRILPACLASAALFFLGTASSWAQGAISPEERDWRPPRAVLSSSHAVPTSAPWLLTPEQGREIVNAAWQLDQFDEASHDCSHFVHSIYASAGFDYPYASSRDIYAGNENFVRVKYSRTGDLIVWRGHVGIVVDAHEHTFYSLLRKGTDVEDYESPYWRSRGVPRFFRYKLRGNSVLSAERERETNAPPSRAYAHDSITPQESAIMGSEERVAAPASTPDAAAPPAGKHAAIYGPPAPPIAEADESAARSDDAPAVPKSVVVADANKAPTREDVMDAVAQVHKASGSLLRTTNPLDASTPIVIVEKFDVERVDTKRDHGWARMVIESKAVVGNGATQVRKRRDKVRWELRRTDSGWEAIPPTDRIYVPTDLAVKNLSAQLARLSASDAAGERQVAVLRQESQIANLLNALLETK